jgi:hypothetical protein
MLMHHSTSSTIGIWAFSIFFPGNTPSSIFAA